MLPYILAAVGGYLIGDSMKKQYADGGMMAKGGKENLEKELRRLVRDLNSSRLRIYKEGDTSEEEMARQREREIKLARFNEVRDLYYQK